jgi:hypothetical protein
MMRRVSAATRKKIAQEENLGNNDDRVVVAEHGQVDGAEARVIDPWRKGAEYFAHGKPAKTSSVVTSDPAHRPPR